MGRQQFSPRSNGIARLPPVAEINRNIRIAAEVEPDQPECALPDHTIGSGAIGRKLEQFARGDDSAPHSLLSLMASKREFEPGVQLMQQGRDGHVAYIIADGWTFSSHVLKNGSRQVLDVQVPGDVAGLNSLPIPKAAHDVTAITKVQAFEIRFEDFRTAACDDPGMAPFLLWLSAQQNSISAIRLTDIGRRTSLERMAHFILELSHRLRLAGIGTEAGFPCPMTQYLFGDALGLTSVHVNRVLRALRTQGLAHHRRGWISLLNTEALKDLAGFDGTYLCDMRADPGN